MKTIEHTNALKEALALEVPSRELSLRRDPSVSKFWNDNRELLEAAWAEWEQDNKDNLLLPDESLLDPKLRKAINDAWENPEKEVAVADLWEEIIPGVYETQFFDLERLADFRKYLEDAVNSGIPKRAPYGIQLNRYGMMLDHVLKGIWQHRAFKHFITLLWTVICVLFLDFY